MSSSSPAASIAAVTPIDANAYQDPLQPILREDDHFILHFADNRQLFAHALPKWKTVKGYPACKINKRKYNTQNLIGLPYGTVLEVGRDELIPLPDGEDLLPSEIDVESLINPKDAIASNDAAAVDGSTKNDNRNLVDDNTSQKLSYDRVQKLVNDTETSGSQIVATLISNSATFESKTAFSQAKYVKRKQMKYQLRCRIVRITPATLCSVMHLKDSRRISNLREDTLGQVLSNANICAGQRVIVMDTAVQGIITASCVRRMSGYGSVIALHAAGQMPGYIDVVNRMNLTIGEKQSLKWVSCGEVFGDYEEKAKQTAATTDETTGEIIDIEKKDREEIGWPAPLMEHTRNYLSNEVKTEKKIGQFLAKRSLRFTRKLTRNTLLELRELVDGCRDPTENYGDVDDDGNKAPNADADDEDNMDATMGEASKAADGGAPRQCDSLIIASKYDPTATLLRLLPYLAPSCPFVIYHEFLEPLLETFRTLQNYFVPEDDKGSNSDDNGTEGGNDNKEQKRKPMMQRRNIAINLRLTDTWFREYQVLEGRTHPNMMMSQNGGYILMGTKLCPRTGTNELDGEAMKEIRARVGGRRQQQRSKAGGNVAEKKKKRKEEREKKLQGGDKKRSKTES